METLNWDKLDHNTIRELKFACQQLHVNPRGGSKKDYIDALKAYRHAHRSEKQAQQYPAYNASYASPSLQQQMPETNSIQNPYYQNPYNPPYNQSMYDYNQGRPTYRQNQKTPSYSRHKEYRQIESERTKKIPQPYVNNVRRPPYSAKPVYHENDYSREESDASTYSYYSTSESSSERMSPVVPFKSRNNKISKKKHNNASTEKKTFSIISSIVLFILILIVIFFIL